MIRNAQKTRLSALADTALKCKAAKSGEAQTIWDAGYADAQTAVDKTVGPAIKKAFETKTASEVWNEVAKGYRP